MALCMCVMGVIQQISDLSALCVVIHFVLNVTPEGEIVSCMSGGHFIEGIVRRELLDYSSTVL